MGEVVAVGVGEPGRSEDGGEGVGDGVAVAGVDGGQHGVEVAAGDVHEPAEGTVSVADGERPPDEQHAGSSLGAGVGVDDADPLAAGDVAEFEAAVVDVEDLEDATVDHRPLGGEQSLVVGEQLVTGGKELGEHAVFVEHDIGDERCVQQVLEQLALIDLVDDLCRQLADGVGVSGGQEPLRLEVQRADAIVEAVGLAAEVARLVLAPRPARARIVAPGGRPGAVSGEAFDLVPQQLGVATTASYS